MAQYKHRKQFIRERKLLSLIGVEYALANETKVFTKAKLYTASCLIVVNALLALISMYYAFDMLFESMFSGVLLALFFAFLYSLHLPDTDFFESFIY